MNRPLAFTTAIMLLGAGALPASAQGVPTEVSFTARLADGGVPATGSHALVVKLYADQSGGSSVWSEQHGVTVNDGMLYVDLGTETPLDATVFDGGPLYLEITVDGTIMSPRVPILSVPYAVRADSASVADSVGTLTPGDLQRRVTGTCSSGRYVQSIGANGGVSCGTDANTTYSAGTGLNLSSNTFSANTTYLQRRVTGSCDHGVRAVSASGAVSCAAFSLATHTVTSSTTTEVTATTSTAKRFCALTQVKTNISSVNGTNRYCIVTVNANATWTVTARSNGAGNVTCTMMCF